MFRTFSAILGIAFAVAACEQSPQSASSPPPPPPPPQKNWLVFFDTNSANLSSQARTTVGEAASIAKSTPNSNVVVTGYTDTDGPPAYNKTLSLKRANAVKDQLARDGVPAQSITVSGAGEEGLLVPTADQTKNENNRRVQIVVQ